MGTASLTDADVRVRDAVLRKVDWDPEVDAGAVGVAAKNGTVTLTGYIEPTCASSLQCTPLLTEAPLTQVPEPEREAPESGEAA